MMQHLFHQSLGFLVIIITFFFFFRVHVVSGVVPEHLVHQELRY